MERISILEAIRDFKGDKRTKEYKELITKMVFPLKDYEKLKSLKGKVTSEELVWLFKLYNETFNRRETACMCGGKIRRMIIRLIKTWEKVTVKIEKDEEEI